jgi:hypothetical protein
MAGISSCFVPFSQSQPGATTIFFDEFDTGSLQHGPYLDAGLVTAAQKSRLGPLSDARTARWQIGFVSQILYSRQTPAVTALRHNLTH